MTLPLNLIVTLRVMVIGNIGRGKTAEGTGNMVTLNLMMLGGTSAGQRGGAQTQQIRVTAMNMGVDLKLNGEGRSTHTGEGIADILQDQILTLQTIVVMMKSGDQPRRTILGAVGATADHQMMTLRRRSGQDTGSVTDQVMRMHHQIPTAISAIGAAPWGSRQMMELPVNQRR